MKSIHKITTVAIILLSLTTSIPAATSSDKSIVTTASEAGVFETLLTAATAAGLAEWIDDATPKTLFAPTDEAFAKLPAGTVASLLEPENQAQLIRILQYHIVIGKVTAAQLNSGIVGTALSAGLKIQVGNGVVLNDSINVTQADIEAKNGIIHVIDSVLLPPEGNVVDLVANDPDLSILTTALAAAGLIDTLRTGGPFTIFAPTNTAFASLPEGTLDTLLAPENLSQLQNILLYHVSAQSIYSNDLNNGPVSALNGGTLTVNLDGPIFGFPGGGANPVTVDLLGKNGVIHKIDTVMLPGDNNLVDTLASDGRFSTLLTAAGAAGLAEVLTTIDGATVFAPTDTAFASLPVDLLQSLLLPENKELLKNVLLYHVLAQNVYANTLSTRAYSTAAGAELRVDVGNDSVMAGPRSKVIETDITASNGVIHIVDQVILPPLNMADTLASMPAYSTLVAALQAANLYDTLNTAGPFTLFAPTNAAFSALPAGTIENLLLPENLATLQSILLAHVLGEKTYGGKLLSNEVTTLQGKQLNIHFVHGELRIGTEATITNSDIPVWNGVIHSINSVLLP